MVLTDLVTFEQVKALVMAGLFPVAFCPTCHSTQPADIRRTDDGLWRGACSTCQERLPIEGVEFRDRTALDELGFTVLPPVQ